MDDNSEKLRAKAKEELRQGKVIDTSLYETDMKVLVEELSIYQIELEHQNQELIQSQECLHQSNNRYLDLFDNAPIGYLIIDSDGVLKDINQTACTMLKCSKSELANYKITKFIHPDFQDSFYIYFRSLINHKHSQFCDIKLRKSNNTYFFARIQGVPTPHISIENIEFRLAIIDISVQKAMEQNLLISKEKAEESDRLKSAFLANMSHEIRTPMNGILGFAELLKEPNLSGEEQQEYIQIIEKSGQRMLNIINDIIDISKIEAGLMKLDISESNINEQIEYIYTFFKPEVDAKRMKFSFKTTLSTKEATIKTDREKVYAILTNLVKNAIKYSCEGRIEFGYDLVLDNKNSHNPELIFYVKDSGIGIPNNRQEAIFERFIQADIADLKARQGAGLGLAISRAYVDMLGGKIWVESEEDKGSVFYFTIPYHLEAKQSQSFDNHVLVNGVTRIKKLKLLIAEDDEISEKLISMTIYDYCKDIMLAKNGHEAVDICRANPDIDLILMDIQMPDLNGYEATRQIREFNKSVIIIAQTAYGLSGDREKAIKTGCNDYISKPINKNEFLLLIQKYFWE